VNAAVETRTFGVSAREVAAVDDWIVEVATHWGKSERTAFRTRLCIAELADNVLEHGGVPSAHDQIVVTLRHLGDGIGVEFLDTRAPFDPTRELAPLPDAASIEALQPGGLGLRLVHAYARGLAYRNDGTRNRVTFRINSA
jgi:anti-sigma regulatory factor (Ser/Thr protein kinase)